jgi:hypothetical protein
MKLQKLTLFVSVSAVATLAIAAADDNPIKKAMQLAHKAPQGEKKISEKIVAGTASDDEVKLALDAYKAIGDTKPPKGDPAAFKDKLVKLIVATEDVVAKKPGAADAYKSASNCKACHSEHKEDKK